MDQISGCVDNPHFMCNIHPDEFHGRFICGIDTQVLVQIDE